MDARLVLDGVLNGFFQDTNQRYSWILIWVNKLLKLVWNNDELLKNFFYILNYLGPKKCDVTIEEKSKLI
jgi:hypothetical protein